MENLQKVKNYVSRFRDTAEKLELKYKIPALLILGVSALETGWGLHAPNNNFFGIKATEKEKRSVGFQRTYEYENGKKEVRYCRFASYATPDESFEAFCKLLLTPRYSRAMRCFKLSDMVEAVAECGYSTSPLWSENVMKCIQMICCDSDGKY